MQTALAAVLEKLEAKDKQIEKLSSSLDATTITAVLASESASVANIVAAASINLPKMWLEETELWFARAQATFAQKNITREDTKYNHVVGLLDAMQAGLVNDILTESPAQPQQYTSLKQRLLEETTLKPLERVQRLLNMKGFGDKTSSTALQNMIKLLPTRERPDPGSLFRELFLQQLAPEIQQLLAQTEHTGTDQKNLKALAAQADLYFMSTGRGYAQSPRQTKRQSRMITSTQLIQREESSVSTRRKLVKTLGFMARSMVKGAIGLSGNQRRKTPKGKPRWFSPIHYKPTKSPALSGAPAGRYNLVGESH